MTGVPFPATQLIHTAWSRHHQPIVLGSMNGLCKVTDPARQQPGTLDPDTDVMSAPTPHVVVPDGTLCRVQRIQEYREGQQAGETVRARLYQVGLPIDAPLADQGMHITITGRVDDAKIESGIIGTTLTIVDRYRGTEEWERVYICEYNAG